MVDVTHSPGLSEESIGRLLALFYGRVRQDPDLGPVFARAVSTTDAEWTPHLARIAEFWWSVMLRIGKYHGDPFAAHMRLPDLQPAMFDRWLSLFGESCNELFEPDVAEAFRERAERISRSLRLGLFTRPPARGRACDPKETRP